MQKNTGKRPSLYFPERIEKQNSSIVHIGCGIIKNQNTHALNKRTCKLAECLNSKKLAETCRKRRDRSKKKLDESRIMKGDRTLGACDRTGAQATVGRNHRQKQEHVSQTVSESVPSNEV